MGPDESFLIARVLRGDASAFEEIVRLHQRRVYGVALRIVRNHGVADDVAQEAFLRAWRSLDRFELGRPFGPWVCRIAANLAVNHVRSPRAREQGLPEGYAETKAAGPGPLGALLDTEAARVLDAAMAELPREQRAVLVMRAVEEMSYAEIAETLGISPGTVMSRLFRARERLALRAAPVPGPGGREAEGGSVMSGHEHERLSAYLDDALAPAERAQVAAHLGACAECATRLAELAAVDGAVGSVPSEAPSGYFESFPARLRARLEPRAATRRLPVWTWAAAAALLLAVVTPSRCCGGPTRPRYSSPEIPAAAAPELAPVPRQRPQPGRPSRPGRAESGGARPATRNRARRAGAEEARVGFASAPNEADARRPSARRATGAGRRGASRTEEAVAAVSDAALAEAVASEAAIRQKRPGPKGQRERPGCGCGGRRRACPLAGGRRRRRRRNPGRAEARERRGRVAAPGRCAAAHAGRVAAAARGLASLRGPRPGRPAGG